MPSSIEHLIIGFRDTLDFYFSMLSPPCAEYMYMFMFMSMNADQRYSADTNPQSPSCHF
ncbi:predicted protein [Sclerotinia sclerotiorum 1980 UF-70]|uniref:Uncharacterized protein n=1 Tax=Sclerotinia sclerotiorum (strain ATCC 18683 / 1980 / Ss-1) TaxID=665079 RepID=A7EU52_SCLS1|nr:predicted protein [Sclerotinia sclerotiorum 1980 UF-70]EDN92994.1 predicted protein [Sclerotinia sclerotiorum 1980 UF-70]